MATDISYFDRLVSIEQVPIYCSYMNVIDQLAAY